MNSFSPKPIQWNYGEYLSHSQKWEKCPAKAQWNGKQIIPDFGHWISSITQEEPEIEEWIYGELWLGNTCKEGNKGFMWLEWNELGKRERKGAFGCEKWPSREVLIVRVVLVVGVMGWVVWVISSVNINMKRVDHMATLLKGFVNYVHLLCLTVDVYKRQVL